MVKQYRVHATITIVALFLAAIHLIFPGAKIDAVTLTLFAIAVLPWLGSIFRSVEFPGGLKVQYPEGPAQQAINESIRELERGAKASDLLNAAMVNTLLKLYYRQALNTAEKEGREPPPRPPTFTTGDLEEIDPRHLGELLRGYSWLALGGNLAEAAQRILSIRELQGQWK